MAEGKNIESCWIERPDIVLEWLSISSISNSLQAYSYEAFVKKNDVVIRTFADAIILNGREHNQQTGSEGSIIRATVQQKLMRKTTVSKIQK